MSNLDSTWDNSIIDWDGFVSSINVQSAPSQRLTFQPDLNDPAVLCRLTPPKRKLYIDPSTIDQNGDPIDPSGSIETPASYYCEPEECPQEPEIKMDDQYPDSDDHSAIKLDESQVVDYYDASAAPQVVSLSHHLTNINNIDNINNTSGYPPVHHTMQPTPSIQQPYRSYRNQLPTPQICNTPQHEQQQQEEPPQLQFNFHAAMAPVMSQVDPTLRYKHTAPQQTEIPEVHMKPQEQHQVVYQAVTTTTTTTTSTTSIAHPLSCPQVHPQRHPQHQHPQQPQQQQHRVPLPHPVTQKSGKSSANTTTKPRVQASSSSSTRSRLYDRVELPPPRTRESTVTQKQPATRQSVNKKPVPLPSQQTRTVPIQQSRPVSSHSHRSIFQRTEELIQQHQNVLPQQKPQPRSIEKAQSTVRKVNLSNENPFVVAAPRVNNKPVPTFSNCRVPGTSAQKTTVTPQQPYAPMKPINSTKPVVKRSPQNTASVPSARQLMNLSFNTFRLKTASDINTTPALSSKLRPIGNSQPNKRRGNNTAAASRAKSTVTPASSSYVPPYQRGYL